jgi:hypothetical protein
LSDPTFTRRAQQVAERVFPRGMRGTHRAPTKAMVLSGVRVCVVSRDEAAQEATRNCLRSAGAAATSVRTVGDMLPVANRWDVVVLLDDGDTAAFDAALHAVADCRAHVVVVSDRKDVATRGRVTMTPRAEWGWALLDAIQRSVTIPVVADSAEMPFTD